MNRSDFIQSVWKIQPSVSAIEAADEEGQKNVTLPDNEATALVRAIHKACFNNANADDSESASGKILSGVEKFNFSWWSGFVSFVVSNWSVDIDTAKLPDGKPWNEDAMLQNLHSCIVDDCAPQIMPYADVLTVAFPKHIRTEFKTYVSLTEYSTHSAAYDKMWDHLFIGSESTTKDKITQEQFARWFSLVYTKLFHNATAARAEVAAAHHWHEAIAATGHCGPAEYRLAARRICQMYANCDDADAFYEHLVEEVLAAIERDYEEAVVHAKENDNDVAAIEKLDFYSVKLQAPSDSLLKDPVDFYIRDNLNSLTEEAEFFSRPTKNRVVVCGLEGVGKSTLAAALAKRLNTTFLDSYTLALEACKNGNDEIGKQLKKHVADRTPIPLKLQSTLLRRQVEDPATVHRGYVLGDIPSTIVGGEGEIEAFLTDLGLEKFLARSFVNVECPVEYYDEWRGRARKRQQNELNAEMNLREKEAGEERQLVKEAEEKEEKKRRREARAELKAKVDAGEYQPTDAEKVELEQPDEEPEEEKPELDAEGNPIEPEILAQMKTAKKNRIEKRIFEFELKRLLLASRETTLEAEQAHPVTGKHMRPLQSQIELCKKTNNFVSVPCFDEIDSQVEYIVSKLKFQPSIAPLEPTLTTEMTEGIETGPDGDIALAGVKQRAMSDLGFTLSVWQRYCPVTFYERAVLVEGTFTYSCHYRGLMYCFTSHAYLQKFIASPHQYLLQLIKKPNSVLVIKRKLSSLDEASIKEEDFLSTLAEQLRLTLTPFSKFTGMWREHGAESDRRDGIRTTRKTQDEKLLAAREERRIKRAKELEAKRKKERAAAAKKKKKTEEKEEEPPQEAESKEEQKEDVAPVVTTEDKLALVISAAVEKGEKFPPLLVTTTTMNDEEIQYILQRKVMPETVVVLDYAVPKKDDDGEEVIEEEPEEPAPVIEDPVDGEEGAPKAVKPPKEIDLTEEKQYKRYVRNLLEKFAVPPEEVAEGNAADERQAFTLLTFNAFNRTTATLVSDIVAAVCPISPKALPPGEGEDIIADPEPEGDEAQVNPLLVPGKKAIHQFGATLKFCPVTLKESGTLVYGDPSFWCTFLTQKYLFVSAQAMEAFKSNPMRYLPAVPPVPPPPRLWILGVPSAGKRSLAGTLSEKYQIPILQVDDEFLSKVIDASNKEGGASVDGIAIPYQPNNPYLAIAMKVVAGMNKFDQDQQEKLQLKETILKEQADREARRDAGEEVEEIDDEEEAENAKIIEFEPEEAEAKVERLGKCQRQILAALSRVEPFETSGYILCGHPNSETEFQQIIDEGAYPEAVVQLKLSQEVFISRRLDAEYEKRNADWKEKVAAAETKRKQLQLQARRIELAKWRRRNIGADDEPAPELEEPPEDPEPIVIDNVKADLEAAFDTEQGSVATVVGLLPERRIPLVEINGDAGRETVVAMCIQLLAASLTRRSSLFEAPQLTTFDDALNQLSLGTKSLSSFRFCDPVDSFDRRHGIDAPLQRKKPGVAIEGEDLLPEIEPPKPKEKVKHMVKKTDDDGNEIEVEEEVEEEAPPPEEEAEPEPEPEAEPELSPEELEEMQKEFEGKKKQKDDEKKQRAVILRNRIYFFNSNENALRFLQSPLEFWSQPPPYDTQSTVVAVIEQPPETKGHVRPRSMSHDLAQNQNFVFIDAAKLLKWCVGMSNFASMSAKAKQYVLTGEKIADEYVAIALTMRLKSIDVLSSGCVLQNLPRNSSQFKILLAQQIPLHKVFVSNVPPSVDSSVLSQISSNARIVHQVKNTCGTLAALVECRNEITSHVLRRQSLTMRREFGFPAPIDKASLTEGELAAALSVFKWYCPFMWAQKRQLVDTGDDRRFAAEYLSKIYCFSEDVYLQQFLLRPDTYSGEVKLQLMDMPKTLPKRLTSTETQTPQEEKVELEFCGCCPVTLFETRHNLGLKGATEPTAIKGSPSLVAEYDGKYYTMVDERAMTQFLRQPWVYASGATLPLAEKLPFEKSSLGALPGDKYIIHALYEDVARALLAVSATRPKFPGLSIENSALCFIALHLKAKNKSNTEFRSRGFKENFEKFEERSTLYKTITTAAPEDPEELAKFEHRCKVWDDVQDDLQCFKGYATLSAPEESPAAAQSGE